MQFSVASEVKQIEDRLHVVRVPLARLLVRADIDRSTWSRWRSGNNSPTLANSNAVVSAVHHLTAAPATSAACIPISGDTSARAGASSPGPIPEIAGSPARAGGDVV